MPASILLSAAQIANLKQISKSAHPNESCAFLLGAGDGNVKVAEIMPMHNADRSPHSFSIEPPELLRAYKEANERHMQIIGIFHSHPGRPSPSATDLKFMELNPVVWLIYSTTEETFEAFVYEGRLEKVELQVKE